MRKPLITVLCAGPGLGFYVPGIVVHRQLKSAGLTSAVHVYEGLLMADKQQNIPKAKINFHRNFSFALMGQNLAKDPSPYLDELAVQHLLTQWQSENRTHFIVFSGFWIPVLNRYMELCASQLSIELCHIDAANSTSWGLFKTALPEFKHVWFNNWEDKSISYYIDISGETIAPYTQRDGYLIHGGGWGMGTYKEKLHGLNDLQFKLKVIAYEHKDLENRNKLSQYYLIDPDWNTWDLDAAGAHQFPPFGLVATDGTLNYHAAGNYPEVYDLVMQSKAIISKPGAGTLIDSLSSATPLIFLEPFGSYENKNALLWKHFGLGISLQDWLGTGCSTAVLEKSHNRLLEVKGNAKNYVQHYINNLNYGT
ncbi:hypothetical protein HDC92_004950 [Pedobacter sp. AK017]|uniref:hypothetical protein n=1 Tax=Pedobacter sp. AK017 TaxID=2723073 RepID=UPI0016202438|nr:hypothetical protein [Pedobacter sp. AK017]MBB5441243.1 hypothetical protein [Pedobacter sp. AK017]